MKSLHDWMIPKVVRDKSRKAATIMDRFGNRLIWNSMFVYEVEFLSVI